MPIQYATSDVQRIASREGLSAVQQQNMVPSIVSISGLWDGVKDRVKRSKRRQLRCGLFGRFVE